MYSIHTDYTKVKKALLVESRYREREASYVVTFYVPHACQEPMMVLYIDVPVMAAMLGTISAAIIA